MNIETAGKIESDILETPPELVEEGKTIEEKEPITPSPEEKKAKTMVEKTFETIEKEGEEKLEVKVGPEAPPIVEKAKTNEDVRNQINKALKKLEGINQRKTALEQEKEKSIREFGDLVVREGAGKIKPFIYKKLVELLELGGEINTSLTSTIPYEQYDNLLKEAEEKIFETGRETKQIQDEIERLKSSLHQAV